MAHHRRLVHGIALLPACAAAVLCSGIALSAPDAPATNVSIEVKRVETISAGAVPTFLCMASIEQGGEVLSQPKIQTPQGVHASVGTTTDAGIKVELKVLVSSPKQLTYEVAITPIAGPVERHRATITLPE